MRFGKAAIVALCLATVGAAGHPSTAAASDASIKRAIKRYDHKILVAEGHVLSAIGQYKKTGQPAGVEAALSKSIAVFRSLKAKIAAQSAIAPKVKQGKLKLIKGLQAVISAYQHLKTAFAIKATNPRLPRNRRKRPWRRCARDKKNCAKGCSC